MLQLASPPQPVLWQPQSPKKRNGDHVASTVFSPPHTQNKTGQRIGTEKRQSKKEMQIKEERLKQELAAEEHGESAVYYPPSPWYKPTYEADPPIMKDLPPELTQEGHSDHNKIGEEKRQMLELLKEKSDLDYYSDSDSDMDCRYQTLF